MTTDLLHSWRSWTRRSWALSPGLTALLLFSAVLLVSSALGLLLDPRRTEVLQTPVWSKTFKFSVSCVLYAASLLWATTLVQGRTGRFTRMAIGALGWVMVLELSLMVIQGVRAQPIHYNTATPLDALLWQIMSSAIAVLLLCFIGVTAVLWRSLRVNPVMGWALRLGMVLTLLGLMQGYLMPIPTLAQQQALEAGATLTLMGAHTVGSPSLTPDAGPGLPLLGWSSTHGDLRVGHFIGLHALQVLPLLGLWLVGRRERWLTQAHRVALVWVGALAYLGLVGLVTWQALRGQPLIAPDTLTGSTLGVLIAATVLSSAAILWHARSRPLEPMRV